MKGSVGFGLSVLGMLVFALVLSHRCEPDGQDLPASPSVEGGLYAFLARQQDPATGLLEGFVRRPDLPPDFLAFLDARPSFSIPTASTT